MIAVYCYEEFWSGKRDSNPRPLPWQGNALPIELFPQLLEMYHMIEVCQQKIWHLAT